MIIDRGPVVVPVKRGVVSEDGGVQALQGLAGVDAEFTGEQVAHPPVGGQRVGLPDAAIQRQHELAVQPLPQRVPGGQAIQLGGECVCRPSARSASIRASTAASRSSSSRAASGRVNA